MKAVDRLFKMINFASSTDSIEALYLRGNLEDGVLELFHAVLFARQKRDRERTNFLGKLGLQHTQCRVFHRGYEDPLSLGEIMTNDISNGVCFPGARWPLRYDSV